MTATGSRSILGLSLFLLAAAASAQTAAKAQATPASELTVDDAFDPPIAKPAFAPGRGPALVVDQKHRNVVSLETYFRPVGRFLGKDGYGVRPGTETFTAEGLAPARVLVIANAQAAEGAAQGSPAFSDAEVRAVEAWVRKGGGLLLIAVLATFEEWLWQRKVARYRTEQHGNQKSCAAP